MRDSPASLASWMAIEPTPPAPPMMSSDWSRLPPFRSMPKRSKSASHGGDRGQRQRRSFGKRECAWLAANETFVYQLELRIGAGTGEVACVTVSGATAFPVASITSATSQPRMPRLVSSPPRPRRIFVSTRLTEMAFTRTSKSRPAGTGRGISVSLAFARWLSRSCSIVGPAGACGSCRSRRANLLPYQACPAALRARGF
jgi:hypothetical protein